MFSQTVEVPERGKTMPRNWRESRVVVGFGFRVRVEG